MCMCNFACKGHPQNNLYCVKREVKPYSLTHSVTQQIHTVINTTTNRQTYASVQLYVIAFIKDTDSYHYI